MTEQEMFEYQARVSITETKQLNQWLARHGYTVVEASVAVSGIARRYCYTYWTPSGDFCTSVIVL